MAEKTTANGATAANRKGKPASITKMDAVRKAMSKLGLHASRGPIRDYVKAQFGIEMTADHVSTCKADILHKKAAKANAGRWNAQTAKPATVTSAAAKAPVAKAAPAKPTPAAAKSKASPATAEAPTQRAKNGSVKPDAGINLQDILAVKDLVGRVGARHLKTLIDAFTC